MNGTNKENNYSCLKCLNIHTPLCELCTQIVSPGEKASKPKFYVNGVSASKKISNCCSLSAKITAKLTNGCPIPLALVIEYNRLIADDSE